MIKNSSRRRDGHSLRLDESARELVAACFVVLFVVAAGLSVLAVHQYGDVDCITVVAMPGTPHRLVADHEWDDLACSIGPCGNSQSAREIENDRMQAAQGGGDATPVAAACRCPRLKKGAIETSACAEVCVICHAGA